MIFPFTAIAVAAQFVIAAAEGVPNINYELGCRASAAANVSLGITVDTQSVGACMAEEKQAHDQLIQQWTQFPPNERMHCEREAALGQMPSYVELQTCLQIARETLNPAEAGKLREEERIDQGALRVRGVDRSDAKR